jgi:hypothetical protein
MERGGGSEFHAIREEFHLMTLLQLGYQILSLGNCIIKLYTEIDLYTPSIHLYMTPVSSILN